MLDAVVAVALPFGVLLVAALVGWAGLGAAGPWTVFSAAAADVWFLGHGVDVRIPADPPFTMTIALLGPALATAVAGVRAGRRAGRVSAPAITLLAGVVTVVLASALLLLAATGPRAAPDPVQALLLPAAVYAGALLVGLLPGRRPARRGSLAAGLRAGTGAAALVLAAGAVGVAVLLGLHLPGVVGLYESSSAGIAGGLALTVLQIAMLPTVAVWGAAWLTGAGFALGAGSSVGPLGTFVGPLPSIPLLGALPQHVGQYGLAGVLVPVVAGFVLCFAVRARGEGGPGPAGVLLTALTAAVAAGGVLGLLSAAASGAAGPGRLAEVGPDPLQVAWRTAIEVGVPALIGGAVAGLRRGTVVDGGAAEPAEGPR